MARKISVDLENPIACLYCISYEAPVDPNQPGTCFLDEQQRDLSEGPAPVWCELRNGPVIVSRKIPDP